MGNSESLHKKLQEFDIINPALIFDGDLILSTIDYNNPIYDLSKDVFYLNAIEEKKNKFDKKGTNKFEEFLNKYFYDPICGNVIKKQYKNFFVPFITTEMNENGDGRHLSINAEFSVTNIYAHDVEFRETLKADLVNTSNRELLDMMINQCHDRLRKANNYKMYRLRSKYASYMINKIFSQKANKSLKIDNEFTDMELMAGDALIDDADINAIIQCDQTVLDLLQRLKDYIYSNKSRSYGPKQEQMVKDFMDCFTYDKFIMCFMKKILDHQKLIEEMRKDKLDRINNSKNEIVKNITDSTVTKIVELGEKTLEESDIKELTQIIEKAVKEKTSAVVNDNLDKFLDLYDELNEVNSDSLISSCFVELIKMLKIIDKEYPSYNISIKLYDKKQKRVINYNTNSLKNDYKKYDKMFDDVDKKFFNLSLSQLDYLGLTRNYKNTEKYLEFLKKKDEEILTQAGWKFIPEGQRIVGSREYTGDKPGRGSSKAYRVSPEEIERREFVFDKTQPARRIYGQDKFDGYEGYIYRNGLVLFERYNEEGGLKNNATYVMNMDNFVEFSQLTKPEIMHRIKNSSDKNVRRLYHNKTWKERLNELIESVEETEDSVMRVESLPDNKERK